MDKYKFWIIFIAIFMCGIVLTTGILSYAWINSPTTWNIEIGLDDDSLQMMNSTLELAESLDNAVEVADEYKNEIGVILNEI